MMLGGYSSDSKSIKPNDSDNEGNQETTEITDDLKIAQQLQLQYDKEFEQMIADAKLANEFIHGHNKMNNNANNNNNNINDNNNESESESESKSHSENIKYSTKKGNNNNNNECFNEKYFEKDNNKLKKNICMIDNCNENNARLLCFKCKSIICNKCATENFIKTVKYISVKNI